jgi:hypothetical protein
MLLYGFDDLSILKIWDAVRKITQMQETRFIDVFGFVF